MIENQNHLKITYDITVLNKNAFIKFMHTVATVREVRPTYK